MWSADVLKHTIKRSIEVFRSGFSVALAHQFCPNRLGRALNPKSNAIENLPMAHRCAIGSAVAHRQIGLSYSMYRGKFLDPHFQTRSTLRDTYLLVLYRLPIYITITTIIKTSSNIVIYIVSN